MQNTEIWDKVARPPSDALKPIAAGRLKGKTDISPQWRLRVMTEIFGPCGKGWHYTIDRLWSEQATDGQMFCFANVSIYIGDSHPIQGTGGSMLIKKETSGNHSNDEGYKMAVTDALSVAMKALGVGADIYMGRWDGSKYIDPVQQKTNIPISIKRSVFDKTVACLANADQLGLKQIWDEFDQDEQVVLWSMFNSEQRRSIKSLMEDLK